MDQLPVANPSPRQLTQAEMRQRFGLVFKIDPTRHTVVVPDEWRQAYLVHVVLVPGMPSVLVHRDAAPVFTAWFARVRLAGLADRVVTIDGGFAPRLKRGKDVPANESGLSRHARGIAVDLNAGMNPMGTPGAQLGQRGCLAELVPFAREVGLVWGGDWHGASCDPMHFEIGAR
jgi:hypothetical protein